MIKPTSRKAYKDLYEDGVIEKNTNLIAKLLKRRRKGVTRRQIEALTGLRPNQVSGRVREMVESKRVEIRGTMKCPITGNEVEAVFYGGSHD
jgi:predicted transcriptional regulator